MPAPTPPRAKDDQILAFLRLRANGVSITTIGSRFGVSPSYVDQLTRKVREADIAESGEPVLAVDRSYWRARKRGQQ